MIGPQRALEDGEALLERALRLVETVLHVKRGADLIERAADLGMIIAVDALLNREHPLVQRQRRLAVALVKRDGAQLLQRLDHPQIVGAETAFEQAAAPLDLLLRLGQLTGAMQALTQR